MAGNEEVYDGLNAFSKLMQGKIFREKEIKIKVKEELEIVQFYLYLQKSRYQDKLSYEVMLENPDIENNLIPRLLIEPLVENAVKYATNKMPVWNISVEAWEEEGKWFVSVKDNGTGFPEETLREVPWFGTKTGKRNAEGSSLRKGAASYLRGR